MRLAELIALGFARFKGPQRTAGATGVLGETAAGAFVNRAGATVLTKSGVNTTFPGQLVGKATTIFSPVFCSDLSATSGFGTANGADWWYIRAGSPFINFKFGALALQDISLEFNDNSGTLRAGLRSSGPGIIEQRNGAAAQKFAVANTWTNDANKEEWVVDWQTTANVCTVGTRAAGTGTLRPVTAVGAWSFASRSTFSSGLIKTPIPIASLPSAASNDGSEYTVNDALAPAWGTTVAAGGSQKVTVMAHASAWVVQ